LQQAYCDDHICRLTQQAIDGDPYWVRPAWWVYLLVRDYEITFLIQLVGDEIMQKRVGVVGVGDMGSGLALNLIKNGFETCGNDLLDARMQQLQSMGGNALATVAEVGAASDVVYVMVMTGDEAHDVINDSYRNS